MLFHMPRLVFHGSMSVFMGCGGFSWFFSVPDYFFMVPGRFYDHLWFQVVFFMVPGPRSVFMVIHGSRLFFYVSGSVFMVNHGSRLVFHGSRSVFYVFFMVPG